MGRKRKVPIVVESAKPADVRLSFGYTPAQEEVFTNSNRYIMLAKGRRFGATKGASLHIIESMLDGKYKKVLWVDTTNLNVNNYMDRYFYPVLRLLPANMWEMKQQKKQIHIAPDAFIDFRSADRPENIEGFYYDLIVINEAGIVLKDPYLWSNCIRPMAMDLKAKCFFIGTPKGKLGTDGKEHAFLQLYKKGLRASPDYTEGYKSFKYSSYDNPLIDPEEIKEMERDVPALTRSQEIYGEFIDNTEMQIFREAWMIKQINDPDLILKQRTIQSWDTAFKKGDDNDYSVCTTWVVYDTYIYLLDVYREKCDFPELVNAAKKLYERFKPDTVLIEDKASGQSLIQSLGQHSHIPIHPVKVDTDKITRAAACSPLFEQLKIRIKDTHWTNTFIQEMVSFPFGEFDDQVDSVSQALGYIKGTGVERKVQLISHKIILNSPNMRGY